MLEDSMIRKWKKQYGRIFRCKIQNEMWYYRCLNVGEVRTISLCEDQEEKELLILKNGIIHPKIESLSDISAGAADSLVLLISNATDAAEDSIMKRVSEERDHLGMSDDYLKWKIEIIKTLNYTPDRVDSMSINEFIKCIVLTEEIQGRPLVSVGKDDGTTTQTQEVDDRSQPNEIENGNPGDINLEESLRAKYLAEKERKRRRYGRNPK